MLSNCSMENGYTTIWLDVKSYCGLLSTNEESAWLGCSHQGVRVDDVDFVPRINLGHPVYFWHSSDSKVDYLLRVVSHSTMSIIISPVHYHITKIVLLIILIYYSLLLLNLVNHIPSYSNVVYDIMWFCHFQTYSFWVLIHTLQPVSYCCCANIPSTLILWWFRCLNRFLLFMFWDFVYAI